MMELLSAIRSQNEFEVLSIIGNHPMCLLKGLDDGGNRALHLAVIYGNVRITELLIRNGANLWAANDEEETVLHLAVRHQQTAILTYLLHRKSTDGRPLVNQAILNHRNQEGKTPLCLAAEAGIIEYVEALETFCQTWNIEEREGMHVPDVHGMTALCYSYRNGFTDIAEYYLTQDYALENIEGALGILRSTAKGQYKSSLSLLRHMRYSDGETVLHKLIQRAALDDIESLIKQLGDIDREEYSHLLTSPNNQIKYSIDYAAEHQDVELFRILITPYLAYLAANPGAKTQFDRVELSPTPSLNVIREKEIRDVFERVRKTQLSPGAIEDLKQLEEFECQTLVQKNEEPIANEIKYRENLARAQRLQNNDSLKNQPHIETYLQSVQATAISKRMAYEINHDQFLYDFANGSALDQPPILDIMNFLKEIPLLGNNPLFNQIHLSTQEVFKLSTSVQFNAQAILVLFTVMSNLTDNQLFKSIVEWLKERQELLDKLCSMAVQEQTSTKEWIRLLLNIAREMTPIVLSDHEIMAQYITVALGLVEDIVFQAHRGKAIQNAIVKLGTTIAQTDIAGTVNNTVRPFIDLQHDINREIKDARKSYYLGDEGKAREHYAEATWLLVIFIGEHVDAGAKIKDHIKAQMVLPEDLEYEGYQILRPMLSYLNQLEEYNNLKVLTESCLCLYEVLDQIIYEGISEQILITLSDTIKAISEVDNLAFLKYISDGLKLTAFFLKLDQSSNLFKLGINKHKILLTEINVLGKELEYKAYTDWAIVCIVIIDCGHDIFSSKHRTFLTVTQQCFRALGEAARALEQGALLAGSLTVAEFSLAIDEIAKNKAKANGFKRFTHPLVRALDRTIKAGEKEPLIRHHDVFKTVRSLRAILKLSKFAQSIISVATGKKTQKAAKHILEILGAEPGGVGKKMLSSLAQSNPATANWTALAGKAPNAVGSLAGQAINAIPPIAIANLALGVVNLGVTAYFGVKIRQDLEKIDHRLDGISVSVDEIKSVQHSILNNMVYMQQQIERVDLRLEKMQVELKRGMEKVGREISKSVELITSRVDRNTEVLLASNRCLREEMQKGFIRLEEQLNHLELSSFSDLVVSETSNMRRTVDRCKTSHLAHPDQLRELLVDLVTFLTQGGAGVTSNILTGTYLYDNIFRENDGVIFWQYLPLFLGFLNNYSASNYSIEFINNLPNHFLWVYLSNNLLCLLDKNNINDDYFGDLRNVVQIGKNILIYFNVLKNKDFFEKLFDSTINATSEEGFKKSFRVLEIYSQLIGVPLCQDRGVLESKESIWHGHNNHHFYRCQIKECALNLLNEPSGLISRYELVVKEQIFKLCQKIIELFPNKKDEILTFLSDVFSFDQVFKQRVESCISNYDQELEIEVQHIVASSASLFSKESTIKIPQAIHGLK